MLRTMSGDPKKLKEWADKLSKLVQEGKLNPTEAAKIANFLQPKLQETLNSVNPDLDKAMDITKMLISTLPALKISELKENAEFLKPILLIDKLDKPGGDETPNAEIIGKMLKSIIQSTCEKEGFSDKFLEIAKILAANLCDPSNPMPEGQFLEELKSELSNNALNENQFERPAIEVPATVSR